MLLWFSEMYILEEPSENFVDLMFNLWLWMLVNFGEVVFTAVAECEQ